MASIPGPTVSGNQSEKSSLANPMSYVVVIGRIFYSAIFIVSGFRHFSQETITFAAKYGIPFAQAAVPLSGVLAIFGGISILLGYYARVGACLLVLFLIPVTLMVHNFWAAPAALTPEQQTQFMKNVSMLGAAVLIAYFGSGPLSLDTRGRKK
jgi:putative oxidoreductase